MKPPLVLPSSAGLDPVAHLARLAAGPFAGCELRADASDAGWIDAARTTGWHAGEIRERWEGPLSNGAVDPAFVPASTLGRAAFEAALDAVLTEPPSATERVEDWLPHHPADLGMWGTLDGAVLVPRVVEAGVGSLLFIGVAADSRGTGLGSRAHATALALLHDAGARHYTDETGAENTPMLRLFARAGLHRTARFRTWVRP